MRISLRSRGLLVARVLGVSTLLIVGPWGIGSISAPASAATNAGAAQVVVPEDGRTGGGEPLTTGGSATQFGLKLPAGAACTGDSAGGNYRWRTYMVPASVDPATLTFGSSGPLPPGSGSNFRQPLPDATGSPVIEKLTDQAATPGGPGLIIGIPAMSLNIYGPGDIPPGTYNIGIACTLGPQSATQLDKYWIVQLVVTSDPADLPAGITWTSQSAPVTTTTTTVTTTSSPTTSSPTSTSLTSTSTTLASSGSTTTTSTATSSATTTSTAARAGAATSPVLGSSSRGLPGTGMTMRPLLLALLAIDFGWLVVRRSHRRLSQQRPGP